MQNWLHKLIGIGPDCMEYSLYGNKKISLYPEIINIFENNILSNAHCDFITQLINTGLLGCITYFGLFLTSAVRFFKSKKPFLIIWGICICSYLFFNIFSFQQIYNTTHIYLLLGIGEGIRRFDE